MSSKNKLESLSKDYEDYFDGAQGFKYGFQEAFKMIDEELAKECNKLELHQFNGERLMTLKLYKARIANILVEMEKNYE